MLRTTLQTGSWMNEPMRLFSVSYGRPFTRAATAAVPEKLVSAMCMSREHSVISSGPRGSGRFGVSTGIHGFIRTASATLEFTRLMLMTSEPFWLPTRLQLTAAPLSRMPSSRSRPVLLSIASADSIWSPRHSPDSMSRSPTTGSAKCEPGGIGITRPCIQLDMPLAMLAPSVAGIAARRRRREKRAMSAILARGAARRL
mmetsp:Transcript_11155/g.29719  ORF Transcript_11155/g.29719 Transcript_11155/m.29719 type:complete len:200 (+) Transcript_11155:1051-1650(+)